MKDGSETGGAPTHVKIWDAPVRLVHWLIAGLFGLSWWSAEQHDIVTHRYSGYAIMALVLFRIYWGFAGSQTARFSNFLSGPRRTFDYARGMFKRAPSSMLGHNPLGALAVIVLICLLAAQTVTGLFVTDIDGLESGPLSYHVDFETSRFLAELHELIFNLLLIFVVLHLAAILFYFLFKRDNLVGPMVTGRKRISGEDADELRFARGWHAGLAAIAAAAVVWAVITYG